MQNQPPPVPSGATQGGADPAGTGRGARWPWAEASVWTDRMLAALENGVKGGVWFSLIDKVYKRANLWSAWCKAARKTRRTDGRSLPVIIQDVNRTMRGWFGYFKHSHRAVFAQVDGWVRDRIRSLLRKRHKLRGRADVTDRQRWGIAFFARHGLYSLQEAHRRASRPATVAH